MRLNPGTSALGSFPGIPRLRKKRGLSSTCMRGSGKANRWVPRITFSVLTKKPASKRVAAVLPACLPPPGHPLRIEHEYERGGALQYLAAWDVRRGYVMGRCEPTTGIEPFGRVVPRCCRTNPIVPATAFSGL